MLNVNIHNFYIEITFLNDLADVVSILNDVYNL